MIGGIGQVWEIQAPLFRVRRGLSVQFRERLDEARPARSSISPQARNLALGHRLVRAVEQGEASSFAELAHRMGVSRARVSVLVDLTFLAPDLQGQVLAGSPKGPRGLVALLRVARLPNWGQQRRQWTKAAS